MTGRTRTLKLEVTGSTVTLTIGDHKLARTYTGENEAQSQYSSYEEEIKKGLTLLMG